LTINPVLALKRDYNDEKYLTEQNSGSVEGLASVKVMLRMFWCNKIDIK
jgi:hypothetical protein